MNSNDIATSHRAAASPLQAPPCLKGQTGAFNKQPLESNTPDATGGCAAWRPQSQCWCGFAPTTPYREADHGQTTALATH